MPKDAQYLGDGVYVSRHEDRRHIILTTGHHDPAQADNVILLDPSVQIALVEWFERLVGWQAQTR